MESVPCIRPNLLQEMLWANFTLPSKVKINWLVVLLGLLKAFNTIGHQILLQKLSCYEVKGSANLGPKVIFLHMGISHLSVMFILLSSTLLVVFQGVCSRTSAFYDLYEWCLQCLKVMLIAAFADDTSTFFTDSNENLESTATVMLN